MSEDKRNLVEEGEVLRTSNRPTLHLLLCLPPFLHFLICGFTQKASHALISFECLSMTLLRGAASEDRRWRRGGRGRGCG